jgi:signal-transduction protein with cAMP-binding, CBS, and nucleotidyltransferase domain
MGDMTREDLHAALKGLSLFNALDDRGLNALSSIIRLEEYAHGDTIIQQGSPSNGVYLLLAGAVKVSRRTTANAIVVLDTISAGTVFGTLAAIDRKTRGASCFAQGKTVVGRIAMLDFQDLMYGSSALALGFQIVILRSIFQELRQTND